MADDPTYLRRRARELRAKADAEAEAHPARADLLRLQADGLVALALRLEKRSNREHGG